MEIKVIVRNKIAKLVKPYVAVCGNSDYVINFDFDVEWEAYETKTARFKYNGSYTDVVFDGNQCPMPVINDTYTVEIGVFAGDIHTTTPALLPMKKSILCGEGSPEDPTPDVYNQIMDKLNNLDAEGYKELKEEIGNLEDLDTEAKENLVAAINELQNISPSSGTDISLGLTSATIGQTIKVKTVDASGKPTEWETAEMPSGTDEDFELINEVTVAEDVGSLTISVDKDGNVFELKEAVVLSWTVPFAESTNNYGRGQGFAPDTRWGYHTHNMGNSLPAGQSGVIGRYDLIHVKVINGYIMQMGHWVSQNAGNTRMILMPENTPSNAPFNINTPDDEGTPTLKNAQGNITCYKIVGYVNPIISAGSIIRLYGKRV